MKIFFSPHSPFVRKCLVVAYEAGLADRIEKLPSAAHPTNLDTTIAAVNPLGQVPTLVTDDNRVLFDSRVICEYLDHLGQNNMFPKSAVLRWRVLTEQSLADGIMNAGLVIRYEKKVRPHAAQWSDWEKAQMHKIDRSLDYFETKADTYGNRIDIGMITLGCALGYLDYRFTDYAWRDHRPRLSTWFKTFAERPSMRDTVPNI